MSPGIVLAWIGVAFPTAALALFVTVAVLGVRAHIADETRRRVRDEQDAAAWRSITSPADIPGIDR